MTEVGGKGQNLGRLNRYGFLVPAGGVLTAKAYQDFMQHNGLAEPIHAAASIKAEDALENEEMLGEIRRKINEGHIPEAVRKELAERLAGIRLLDKPVAVRSSATAEDSARASFAGVHESFLNVAGLPDICRAVKGCYASLWTPRAVAYRRKMGLTDDEVAAAVVIMELVPAVAAGVAFSCDPLTGRRDRVAISANFGLGESVVSGSIEPDEYLLDSRILLPKIIQKKIGSKKQYTRSRLGYGTELVSSGDGANKRQVLDDSRITELGLLTLRVHEALGSGTVNQDMEWAFYGNKFVVLQARPVTNLHEPSFPETAGQPVIWSNANLKDVMPQVPSTITWNLASCMLPRMMSANLQAAGYHVPPGINWVRLYKGRGYFNLSALQWGFYDAMGFLPGKTNEFIGGHQPEIKVPAGNPLSGLKGMKRVLRQIYYGINILRIQGSAETIFKDIWEKADSWNQLNFSGMNENELISLLSEIREKYVEYAPPYMILGSSASLPLEMLARALDADFPGRGYSLANGLLAGTSEKMTSAEHGYRLMELAQTAQRDDAARRYFMAEHFDSKAFQNEIPEGSQFRIEFEKFLKDYGHRGVYESDLLNPRWREDPGYLLENIRAELLSPRNADYRKAQAEKRNTVEKEIEEKLKWSFQRIKISIWARQARKGAEMREMARSVMVKPYESSRLLLQDIGRRLVDKGILNEKTDVYHCALPEIIDILAGYWDGTGLKILVEDRKRMREELSNLEPPDVIIDDSPQPKVQAPEAREQVLAGIGVAAGRASGRARLIRHPGENTRLQAGDVLVAPSTDPGWTPLFLRANALVMEVGGTLSHGAIVAREYGIPAVVNVPGVMKTLKDGEQLTVDGDEGKVYRA
ncbi:PEP/pyruvate-binding domain-containing protein [Candidatus Methanoperedens nitratireducens]|nr:PEP/pyruvate-binding domain-containing protein [Candidatus Methanoperedens nitroreducens]